MEQFSSCLRWFLSILIFKILFLVQEESNPQHSGSNVCVFVCLCVCVCLFVCLCLFVWKIKKEGGGVMQKLDSLSSNALFPVLTKSRRWRIKD